MKKDASEIEALIREALDPQSVEIEDLSHLHRHHMHGGGGHFRLRIVAECFRGKTPLQRHRLVHQALAPLFGRSIHALSIQALPPQSEEGDAEKDKVKDAVDHQMGDLESPRPKAP